MARGRATIQRTLIVIWPESADRFPRYLSNPFHDQLANHADKLWMCADRFAANHVQAKLPARVDGFAIEVKQDFHVVGQEPDWNHGHVIHAGFLQICEMIADVRLQPGILRPSTPALIDELPAVPRNSDGLSDEPTALGELLDVVTTIRHRIRNAVSRKREPVFFSPLGGNLIEAHLDEFGIRGDEIWMVVEDSDLVDFRSSFTHGFLSIGDVLPVLTAA